MVQALAKNKCRPDSKGEVSPKEACWCVAFANGFPSPPLVAAGRQRYPRWPTAAPVDCRFGARDRPPEFGRWFQQAWSVFARRAERGGRRSCNALRGSGTGLAASCRVDGVARSSMGASGDGSVSRASIIGLGWYIILLSSPPSLRL